MYEIIKANKGLSIERLLLLCEVDKAGGIKAAVGDDTTRQSLASRQLKELGAYAGVNLCRKVGRSLEMTDQGKLLAEIGNRFFHALEEFLRTTHNQPCPFRLGIGDSLFQWQLLPKMKAFESQFPNAQLIPFSYSADEIIRKVENRTLDAGLVRQSSVSTRSDLIAKPIGEIKYRLFVPKTLDKGEEHNSLSLMHDLPFCTLTGDGEYAHAMATFMTAFNGRPALNCSSMTQMYAAVQSGQYAAVLPAAAANGLPPDSMTAYTLPELSSFTRQIALIYKSDANTTSEKAQILKFLENCISCCPNNKKRHI